MPITFPCACGTTLSVGEDPPAYFVRCPRCRATNKVPHPKKKPKPAKDDPGFEVVDDSPARPVIRVTAFDPPKKSEEEAAWEADPYEKPKVGKGYKATEDKQVARGAIQGAGEAEPYEVTEEEFQEDLRQRKGNRAVRKMWRAILLVVIAAIGIGAFLGVGTFTAAIDPGGKGKIGAGLARIAIVFTMLIVMAIVWLVNQVPDDE
jgi:hypothetical protein